jgi:hypothetical protein
MTYKFEHISFPSIPQFKDVIKQIQQSAKHHVVEAPKVLFKGSVKLHGTNAAVVLGLDGEVYTQSRERVLSIESDNAGFAIWMEQHKEYFKKILKTFISMTDTTNTVQIYGEWCGGNIQKGVGLSKLPKMFVIFGVRISENAESQNWIDIDVLRTVMNLYGKPDNVYLSSDFPTFFVNIDFNKPTLSQQELIDLTIEIEKDCPVARKFLPDTTEELIGEGLVWEAVQTAELPFSVRGLRMKTKGSLHSVSKVKVLVPVDLEKVASLDEFVENTCTENRLKQGLDKLREMGLEATSQNTGTYLKWVMGDILKEELDTLVASGLTTKDVASKISTKARLFYMNNLS